MDLLTAEREWYLVTLAVESRFHCRRTPQATTLRRQVEFHAVETLLPGFIRPRIPLDDEDAGLNASDLDALRDDGMTSTVDAAQAPQRRVRLIGSERHRSAGKTLRAQAFRPQMLPSASATASAPQMFTVFAAQYPAYPGPCQRLAFALAGDHP